MEEYWFDPKMYAWIPGTLLGVLGGAFGSFVGIFGSRGRFKKASISMLIGLIVICLALLVLGIVAFFAKQPLGIWFSIGYPGLLGICVLGGVTPVLSKVFNKGETEN